MRSHPEHHDVFQRWVERASVERQSFDNEGTRADAVAATAAASVSATAAASTAAAAAAAAAASASKDTQATGAFSLASPLRDSLDREPGEVAEAAAAAATRPTSKSLSLGLFGGVGEGSGRALGGGGDDNGGATAEALKARPAAVVSQQTVSHDLAYPESMGGGGVGSGAPPVFRSLGEAGKSSSPATAAAAASAQSSLTARRSQFGGSAPNLAGAYTSNPMTAHGKQRQLSAAAYLMQKSESLMFDDEDEKDDQHDELHGGAGFSGGLTGTQRSSVVSRAQGHGPQFFVRSRDGGLVPYWVGDGDPASLGRPRPRRRGSGPALQLGHSAVARAELLAAEATGRARAFKASAGSGGLGCLGLGGWRPGALLRGLGAGSKRRDSAGPGTIGAELAALAAEGSGLSGSHGGGERGGESGGESVRAFGASGAAPSGRRVLVGSTPAVGSSRGEKNPSWSELARNAKATITAHRMFNHAGSTHRVRVRHNSLVKKKLDSAHWQADAVIECISEALPLGSLELLRRAIDAVRFLSNFYLAVYLTTFASLWWGGPSATYMHLSPLCRALAVLSFVPVVLANMFTEPFLSVQFAVISTMSCLNPLLLGETLEFVQETAKMMDFGNASHHAMSPNVLRRLPAQCSDVFPLTARAGGNDFHHRYPLFFFFFFFFFVFFFFFYIYLPLSLPSMPISQWRSRCCTGTCTSPT